jgi:hypothetical protein
LRHYLQATFIEYLLGTKKIWVYILAVDFVTTDIVCALLRFVNTDSVWEGKYWHCSSV